MPRPSGHRPSDRRPSGRRPGGRRPGRRPILLAAVLAGTVAISGCTAFGGGNSTPSGTAAASRADPMAAAIDVATRYLKAWSGDEDSGAAALTSDPAAAARLLSTTRNQLGLSRVAAAAGQARPAPGGAFDVPATVTVTLSGLGNASWPIVVHVVDASRATTAPTAGTSTPASPVPTPVTAGTDGGGRPVVQYSPTLVHPNLTVATRLTRTRTLPVRASILDRDGKQLTVPQQLSEVGIQKSQLRNPAGAYRLIGSLPDHPDVAALQKRVAAAGPDQFVSAITLRAAQYQPFAARLYAMPGIRVHQRTTTLSASPTFARTVLGRLTPAASLSTQALAAAGPLAGTADDIGTSGLQKAAQQQLAGTPGGVLQIVPRAGGDPVKVVQTFPGRPGTSLRTTLSSSAQQVAEAALATAPQAGALVAVQPSTGQLLAVADNGVAASRQDGINRALNGRYPPGSTFKVVSSAALLAGGLSPAATVPCPPTVTVDGRRFSNVDGEAASGNVPFITDFAQSCNTAFIGLRDRVPSSLTDTAKQFGVGLDWTLGVTSYGGSVPAAATETERAAAMIGQGRVLVSPLAMAVVAATVAAGRARTPTLVTGTGQPPVAAQPPVADPRVIAQLRTLTEAAVARGTATGLRGSATGAKTGTAEFGLATGPGGKLPTHSWMIAYRGDLAVAVLIENGSTGARTAGPVMRHFLDAVR